ncbi:MAG: TonB-dependent receptor, partial [Bacteroidia bacterium]
GYTHYIDKLKSLVTVEAYYKRMNNLIEYRPGTVLILNDNYEAELLEGRGDSYGLEFFFNKTKGNFTGWVGYTLSWATRNFDELNNGKNYYAKYDRRHDISLVANYNFTPRFTVSAVWVYATGQRLTARTGNYFMPNPSYNDVSLIPIFSGKNEFRFSPSHRLDINFVIKRKPGRKWEGEWNFGAYNVYNRAQPYRVETKQVNGEYKLVQKGLFGFLPFVAYNFKF